MITRDATPLSIPDTDDLRFLPEGPIALGVDGFISWVGIQHGGDARYGSLNVLDLKREINHSYRLPGRPGFAFPCPDACAGELPTRFVIGMERSLGYYDTADDSWTPFCEGVDADVENTIINDGILIGDNLIFGTKDLEFSERKAGLYLYHGRDQKLIRLRDDQICSNGKMIVTAASGELKLIDIDTPTKKIVQYDLDIDAGKLSNETTVINLTGDTGFPDGAILTPDGTGIIVSIYGPGDAKFGETRWYDRASGELKSVWRTPGSPQNTCPALVIVDGRMKLVVTTAVEHMSAETRRHCVHAGQIFIADTDFDAP
jgi:sugar lactone lactonase YvrE